MIWETIQDDGLSVVERAPYGDGHFVRMSWRHRRDIGVPPLEGSAMIYVPGPMPPQEPPHEEAETAQEAGEVDVAPEADGIAGQDH